MSDSRDRILAAVRRATDGAADGAVPRGYHRSLPPGTDLVALLTDRLRDYRAEVRRVAERELPNTIGAVLGQHGAASVVVPQDLDPAWLTTVTCAVLRDSPDLDAARLDRVDATLTGSRVAIAQTGTIVLDGGALQGRRIMTLLPDLHVCLVRERDIVATVPEGIARLDPARPQTWISGPSATSDIELERVEGVHGPRRLVVLLVG